MVGVGRDSFRVRASESQTQSLEAEIAHALDHEAILIRIAQVMQLDIGIDLKKHLRWVAPPRELLSRFIGMHTCPPYGYETGLRQPGNTEEGAQVHQRTVG